MSFLDLPTELIIMIGDRIHHVQDGDRIEKASYVRVVRYCMSSRMIYAAVEAETVRRYTTAALASQQLKGKALEFALDPPRGCFRYRLLPARLVLRDYPSKIALSHRRAVIHDHVEKIASRGGDEQTPWDLGQSLTVYRCQQSAVNCHLLHEQPASAEILVIRVHPISQVRLNTHFPVARERFVTGVKCSGKTYLALPGSYVLTEVEKDYIHMLFGRYFTTTIAELKDALAKDDADGGVKAQAEYDAPMSSWYERAWGAKVD